MTRGGRVGTREETEVRQGGVKRGSRDYKKTVVTRGDSNDKSDKLWKYCR